ncbi:acyl-CoA thioester hydrolase [Candidatus Magnetomoraceae bacterium gMMP-1]
MLIHKTKYRVIYGDTDNMGVSYYANYLRWFEIGRTELFRWLGLTYKSMEKHGFAMPVMKAYCEYFLPSRYDDLLTIETTLEIPLKAALNFSYQILNESEDKLLAKGYTKHACVNNKGRVVRPPNTLKELCVQSAQENVK